MGCGRNSFLEIFLGIGKWLGLSQLKQQKLSFAA